MHQSQLYVCFSADVHFYYSNNTATCASVILSISHKIFLFLFLPQFASNFEIVSQTLCRLIIVNSILPDITVAEDGHAHPIT